MRSQVAKVSGDWVGRQRGERKEEEERNVYARGGKGREKKGPWRREKTKVDHVSGWLGMGG